MADTVVETEVAAAAPAAEAETDAAPDKGQGVTVLQDRYEIHHGRPLAAFHTPVAKAFPVTDRNGARNDLMALVSTVHTVPRTDILPVLRKIDRPSLMRPIRWGPVDWPPANRRAFAIVYNQPAGDRVMRSLSEETAPMAESLLMTGVVRPILAALEELTVHGIAHRAIRPDNLYFRNLTGDQVVLGDAAMAPPGSIQPALFETIEHAMAHPLGRGPGRIADDLYALGATVLVLFLGRNPVAELDDDTLLANRIEKGSYAVLVGDARIPPTLREAVRGLLADDRSQRWTLNDLSLWLDGRRLAPLQPATPQRANRPFAFDGGEYFSCRALAHAMAGNWRAVPRAVRSVDLELWIRRGLSNPERADAVTVALSGVTAERTAAANQAQEGVLAGRICMALDPAAPIRYRGLSVMADGLGPFLLGLAAEPGGAQRFAELIASRLPFHWIEARYGEGMEARSLIRQIQQLRRFLMRSEPGFGLERCLYELNPALPCQSPLIERYHAVDADELLRALETAVAHGEITSLPTDRHIAAFIAARFGSMTEPYLVGFGARDNEAWMAVSVLRTLALVQWRLGPRTLPALTALVARCAGPVIDAYHGETLRRQLRERLDGASKRGSLSELQNLIDDPGVRERDHRSFTLARARYAAAESEIAALSRRGSDQNDRAEAIASRIAAAVSAVIATVTVATIFAFQLM